MKQKFQRSNKLSEVLLCGWLTRFHCWLTGAFHVQMRIMPSMGASSYDGNFGRVYP